MKRFSLFVGLLVFLVAAGNALAAQAPPPALPPAQYRVYDHLFLQIVAVENAANDADAKNDHGKADGLRKHFQTEIGLQVAEAARLKGHAQACEQQLTVQDKKAADIVNKDRAKYPGGK